MSSKVRLLVLTLCLVVVALVAVATENVQSSSDQTTLSACARCGDGVCARSCENEFSCPRDCGPTP